LQRDSGRLALWHTDQEDPRLSLGGNLDHFESWRSSI
jgi:hypothetical protein